MGTKQQLALPKHCFKYFVLASAADIGVFLGFNMHIHKREGWISIQAATQQLQALPKGCIKCALLR